MRLAAWAFPVVSLAFAATPAGAEPAGRDALPGFARVISAGALDGVAMFRGASGYGFRGAALGTGDRHHRLATSLAASVRHDGWLGVAVQLDGRYDKHLRAPGGDDDSWVGDPRLVARARRGLGADVALAAQLGLWFPSAAPLSLAGTSVEARGAATYTPAPGWSAALNLGARLDRSSASVDDPDRLSLADRMSLGVSDANAVLLGAGVGWRRGDLVVAGEWSWDLLVGDDAPAISASPMRATALAQVRVDRGVWLGAALELGLSATPTIAAGTPLVPIEPRVSGWLSVGFYLDRTTDRDRAARAGDPPAVESAPGTGSLEGVVLDDAGNPVASARVRLGERVAVTDAEGRFRFDEVAAGPRQVVVEVEGFAPRVLEVEVEPGAALRIEADLERSLPPGQIRGLVRDLRGRPLAGARVVLPGLDRETVTAADGRFTLDVPPGAYDVDISAAGFAAQSRRVKVDQNGVTVLNLELRRGPR